MPSMTSEPGRRLNGAGSVLDDDSTRAGAGPDAHHGDPVTITLGFTQSDPAAGYRSFCDGYRIGARQQSVTIIVPGAAAMLTAEQWADAAFEASNLREVATAGPAVSIHTALTFQVRGPLRSLSVGDTVTVCGRMLACDSTGWRPVEHVSRGGRR